jgi:hypothetical protein
MGVSSVAATQATDPSRVTRDRCYAFKNIFDEKFGEKTALLLKLHTAIVFKNLILIFFAENGQKAQKLVIITPTPGWANFA